MPQDITHPNTIKYFIENFEKTDRLRVKWRTEYADTFKKAATLQKEGRQHKSYYDLLKTRMRAGLPTIAKDHVTAGKYRKRIHVTNIQGVAALKHKHSIVNLGIGDPTEDPRLARPDTDTTIDPVMRVVKPEHQNIIYKDAPLFGRAAYLKSRRRILPEDRYYFPECSSWEYGWRVKDNEFSKNRPTRGQVWKLTHENENRTGSQPDPAYYSNCNIVTYSRCNICK